MKYTLHRPAAVIFATLLCAVGVRSQDALVDPRARNALEQMRAAYKSLDALHIKVNWSARYSGSMSPDDFPLPGPEVLELRMQRPNKFYMEASAKGDNGKPTRYLIVSDGTNLWHWRSAPNTYTQVAAPATLPDMSRLLPDDVIGTYDGVTWTVDDILEWDLLVDVGEADLMKSAAESGMAITFGAPEKIRNTAVDVVQVKGSAAPPYPPFVAESTYYLSASSHLVQGLLMTARGKHPDNGRDFSVTMRATYDVREPRFTAADFAFTPPPGARKVATMRR